MKLNDRLEVRSMLPSVLLRCSAGMDIDRWEELVFLEERCPQCAHRFFPSVLKLWRSFRFRWLENVFSSNTYSHSSESQIPNLCEQGFGQSWFNSTFPLFCLSCSPLKFSRFCQNKMPWKHWCCDDSRCDFSKAPEHGSLMKPLVFLRRYISHRAECESLRLGRWTIGFVTEETDWWCSCQHLASLRGISGSKNRPSSEAISPVNCFEILLPLVVGDACRFHTERVAHSSCAVSALCRVFSAVLKTPAAGDFYFDLFRRGLCCVFLSVSSHALTVLLLQSHLTVNQF